MMWAPVVCLFNRSQVDGASKTALDPNFQETQCLVNQQILSIIYWYQA